MYPIKGTMGKSLGIIIGSAIAIGVGFAVKYGVKISNGVQVLVKRPDIDFVKLFTNFDFQLPIKAKADIYNHSIVSLTVLSVEAVVKFRTTGGWMTIGTNAPTQTFQITPKSLIPVSLDVLVDFTLVGLNAVDLVKNKGKNELRTTVTVRTKLGSSSSDFDFVV